MVATVTGFAGNPFGVNVNPAGTFVYVADFNGNRLVVIDTATNLITTNVAVGTGPIASGIFIGGPPLPPPPAPINPTAVPTLSEWALILLSGLLLLMARRMRNLYSLLQHPAPASAHRLRKVVRMPSYSTIYKCRRCGTTSYQPVIARDSTGALTPNGMYRCTGCRVTFTDLREWWGHGGAGHAGLPGYEPDQPEPQAQH